MPKRKHHSLKLSEKVNIFKRIDLSKEYSNVAVEYDVGIAAISDIKKNRTKILR